MKIKAYDMQPGMVIGIKRGDKYDDVCLILATSGRSEVEYRHLDFQDAFGDSMIGTIDGEVKVKVFKGRKKKAIIEKIKDDVFRWKHAAEQLIDMLHLIEAMESPK